MNLENVLEMWKKDNVIDEMALDESSRETAKLHSKYLELHSVSRPVSYTHLTLPTIYSV